MLLQGKKRCSGVRKGSGKRQHTLPVGGKSKKQPEFYNGAGDDKRERKEFRPVPFGGLADFALKLPELEPEIDSQFEVEGLLFRKIAKWLEKVPEFHFHKNVRESVLNFFAKITDDCGSEAVVEDCEEAFGRIDIGGYMAPEDDLVENWFAVSISRVMKEIFIASDGKIRKRGLTDTLRFLKAYSLVRIGDFEMMTTLADAVIDEDRMYGIKQYFPKTMLMLSGKVQPPGNCIVSDYMALKQSFLDFNSAMEKSVSENLSYPEFAMPGYLLRIIEERRGNESDPMREMWDAVFEDYSNESSIETGFLQIGCNMRTEDPSVFLAMLRAASKNLMAQERIVNSLEAAE